MTGIFLIAAFALLFISSLLYCYCESRRFSQWLELGLYKITREKLVESCTDTNSLPPLLKTYLKKVLTEPIQGHYVKLSQIGSFRYTPNDRYAGFKASQTVSLVKPAFSWTAKMSRTGLPVTVCDRLVDYKGDLQARLLACITVARATGPELLRGELLRYLAELPWYPMAILNLNKIEWTQLNESSVSCKIEVMGTKAKVDFFFDKNGLIERIYVADRGRLVGSETIPTPWQGQFSRYKKIANVLIPSRGEVSWILPEGNFTYFKGDIHKYTIK